MWTIWVPLYLQTLLNIAIKGWDNCKWLNDLTYYSYYKENDKKCCMQLYRDNSSFFNKQYFTLIKLETLPGQLHSNVFSSFWLDHHIGHVTHLAALDWTTILVMWQRKLSSWNNGTLCWFWLVCNNHMRKNNHLIGFLRTCLVWSCDKVQLHNGTFAGSDWSAIITWENKSYLIGFLGTCQLSSCLWLVNTDHVIWKPL